MARSTRPPTVEALHEVASAMPHVTVEGSPQRPVYQVGGRSFVFFRTARPDAVDETTGERLDDVVVVWVADEGEKAALVEDPATPYFTTRHFDGHPSVLLRTSRLGEISRDELAELVQDAWLSRVSARRARQWLATLDPDDHASSPRAEQAGRDRPTYTLCTPGDRPSSGSGHGPGPAPVRGAGPGQVTPAVRSGPR